MLHLLQLEHYENARLFHWLRRRGEIADRAMVVAVVLPAPPGKTLRLRG